MIKVFDRKSKTYEEENVVGAKYLNWCYESPIGKGFTELLIKRRLFSKLYGSYCDTKFSKKKINNFIKDFDLDMSITTKKEEEFNSFNDFFIRTLTEDARPFDKDTKTLISPGDGRLLGLDNIDMDSLVQVKGITYSLAELIADNAIASSFNGGVCLILRLCPTDYHRFHFIDNGVPGESNPIKGSYYSVNPTALERIPKLYCQNKREWSIFKSENFGDIIHVEVGATCVGTIIQSYKAGKEVSKGDEKGYFKFGGSTTILFFQKDSIIIDEDILKQTALGFECKVVLGETIGHKKDN